MGRSLNPGRSPGAIVFLDAGLFLHFLDRESAHDAKRGRITLIEIVRHAERRAQCFKEYARPPDRRL